MFPDDAEYAHAYVPFQEMGLMFDLEESLKKGTVFSDLYQPYIKVKGSCECE